MEGGRKRLSTARMLAYSLGSLGASVPGQAFSTYAVFFYVDVLKLPALWVATIGMTIYGIWNAVNDPLLGYLSDRTSTRWGRRIPWIAGGLLPLVVFFILVWTPPALAPGGLFAYFMVVIFLYDFFFTLVVLNWTSLFPEMFPSLKERAVVSAWRQIFGNLGLILGVALAPMLYSTMGWAGMGIALGVVTGAALGVSLLGSREDPSLRGEPLLLGPALRFTLANRSFLTYVLTSLTVQFAFVVLLATLRFYTKYVLGLNEGQHTIMLLACFLMVFILLHPWGRITVRLGPRKTMMVGIVIFGITLLPAWFVSEFVGGVVFAALLGVGLPALMLLLDVLISDVIDEDELRSGARREGMYFGVHALVIRLGISFQGLVMGAVLTFTGYDPRLATQTASALWGLRFLMAGVPLVALVLAFVCIVLYPLHGERLAAVKAEIARRREGCEA
ncbi:MAG: MFS transporter [Bacillota bacterium]|nr:MFS transporter [Bacillota bacterium]